MVRSQSTWPAEASQQARRIVAELPETPKIGWQECRDSAADVDSARYAAAWQARRERFATDRSRETEGFCGNPPIVPAGPDIVSYN